MYTRIDLYLCASLLLYKSSLAAPQASSTWQTPNAGFEPAVDSWLSQNAPGKYQQQCTSQYVQTRVDFDTMQPEDRKSYTDAINCIRSQPSHLDQTMYSGAINRYFDWATVHTNRTRTAHLSGFFLNWHRYYLHTFENDLRNTCGYTGAFPYWNWPATADNLTGSAMFDGSEFSMSGDGYFTNDDPIVLAPTISIPHGSGGGCIMSGPFQGMNRTLNTISIDFLINGTDIPPSSFDKNESCLTRDLNEFAAQKWTNYTAVQQCVEAPDPATFYLLVNGAVGTTILGSHSGAHFVLGDPGSNIFVSAQDPAWYPLHTMLDRLYASWQIRHPEIALSTYGTETAQNLPPSANVTIDTILPDWGYFDESVVAMGETMSTTNGPFCYVYDTYI